MAKAKIAFENQNRTLENGLKKVDSIVVGNFCTQDALLLPCIVGRKGMISYVGEMVCDRITRVRISF